MEENERQYPVDVRVLGTYAVFQVASFDLFRELTRTDTIVLSVIPIYRKYFTEEEIREFIALYKTPVGIKYAKLAGKIQQEGMEVNARQGQMAIINYQVQKGRFTVDPPKQGN